MCFAVEDQTYVTSEIVPFSLRVGEILSSCVWHHFLLNIKPSLRVSWFMWHLDCKSNSWFWWVKKNVVGPLGNVLGCFISDDFFDCVNLILRLTNWIFLNGFIRMEPGFWACFFLYPRYRGISRDLHKDEHDSYTSNCTSIHSAGTKQPLIPWDRVQWPSAGLSWLPFFLIIA